MILQSRRVWILNEWMEAQIEFSLGSGRIEGIYPHGTNRADMDFEDLRVVPGSFSLLPSRSRKKC